MFAAFLCRLSLVLVPIAEELLDASSTVKSWLQSCPLSSASSCPRSNMPDTANDNSSLPATAFGTHERVVFNLISLVSECYYMTFLDSSVPT